jgi:hypothetical protein
MGFFRHLTACLLFFLISSSSLLAQEETARDNEVWSGFSLKYKFNKKIQFGAQQQIRINNNLASIRSNLFEFGARYKWNKHFSTKLQYRYTFRSNQRDVNRYSLDLMAKWRIKRINVGFSYRPRLQHSTVTYTFQPATYIRNKIKLEYDKWKKITPFASYENFYKLNEHNEFRGNRYIIGLDISIDKKLELKVFYGRDQEINTKNGVDRNLFGALLAYTI